MMKQLKAILISMIIILTLAFAAEITVGAEHKRQVIKITGVHEKLSRACERAVWGQVLKNSRVGYFLPQAYFVCLSENYGRLAKLLLEKHSPKTNDPINKDPFNGKPTEFRAL